MKKIVGGLVFLAVSMAIAEVPALLRTAEGKEVATVEEWENVRRPQILELLRKHQFGRNPVERPATLKFENHEPERLMMDGRALRKRIKISYSGAGGSGALILTAFIPIKATKEQRAPAFLLICNRDPEVNIDPERRQPNPFFPAEELIERGYAALAFFNGDVAPDVKCDAFTNGVHAVFQPDPAVRTSDSWGTIAAWAWGASRVMDWIEREELIDNQRVAVVGHSRGGKTALWAGATDRRFALVVSNNSGCGGAKFNRMELPKSESIAKLNRFVHWFCLNYRAYSDAEEQLPFDQHMLLALSAPRLVYVASATLDEWAGPPAEFHSCLLATPAWQLYGVKGLVGESFPPAETPLQEGRIGYHLRSGKHNLTLYDWERYMDFFDKHR